MSHAITIAAQALRSHEVTDTPQIRGDGPNISA